MIKLANEEKFEKLELGLKLTKKSCKSKSHASNNTKKSYKVKVRPTKMKVTK